MTSNKQAAQAYADENGCLFLETSAKTNANVTELFVAIAKKLPKTQPPKPTSHPTLSLQAVEPQKPEDSKCNC